MKISVACSIKTAGFVLFVYLLHELQQQLVSYLGELKFATQNERRRRLAEKAKGRIETVEETCKKYREDKDNVYIEDKHRNRNGDF